MKIIRVTTINIGTLIALTSTILKPAVRPAVTWKNAVNTLSKRELLFARVWSYSKKKKRTVPTAIMKKEVSRAIRVPMASDFHRLRLRSRMTAGAKKSRSTTKPMLPMNTSSMMMTCGKWLLTTAVSINPSGQSEKPALLNADTAWNSAK